jgi:hypothetical protein
VVADLAQWYPACAQTTPDNPNSGAGRAGGDCHLVLVRRNPSVTQQALCIAA